MGVENPTLTDVLTAIRFETDPLEVYAMGTTGIPWRLTGTEENYNRFLRLRYDFRILSRSDCERLITDLRSKA